MSEREFSDRVAECPKSLDEEGPKRCACYADWWMNTKEHQDLEWFGPPERNTLLHCVLYCLRAWVDVRIPVSLVSVCLLGLVYVTLHASLFIAQGGTYKGAEPRHAGLGT
jgi:hypothetical protein